MGALRYSHKLTLIPNSRKVGEFGYVKGTYGELKRLDVTGNITDTTE